MDKIFFESWESLLRAVIIGVLSYISLILMLRIAGSRTLSQLNAFDLIVTVALGSTLSTIILNKDITLSDGLVSLAMLITLQFAVSRISLRARSIQRVIKTEPRVLLYKGQYIKDALEECRISKEEVIQMIRSEGIGTLDDVEAVVLESNGRFSVIKRIKKEGRSSIKNVQF